MSADFSIKPIGASVVTAYVGSASDAARLAASTVLPTDKAVNPVVATSAATAYPQPNDGQFKRQADYDREAAEIVYRVVDSRTDQVVRQLPDDARLRARAYVRAQDSAKAERKARKTDRTV
jgi:hypothetical protein